RRLRSRQEPEVILELRAAERHRVSLRGLSRRGGRPEQVELRLHGVERTLQAARELLELGTDPLQLAAQPVELRIAQPRPADLAVEPVELALPFGDRRLDVDPDLL